MSTISSRFGTVARIFPTAGELPVEAFSVRLSGLYALSQKSNYVFASPLGPVYHEGRHLHLPRFVYFGPHTHDESLRLAFLGGFDSTDLRTAEALMDLTERLAASPELGQGLNLSIFPLIDVIGLARNRTGRGLAGENWARPNAPEINVLEKDARVRGYHGFIRLETTSEDDLISVRLRDNIDETSSASRIEVVSSQDFVPSLIRWDEEASRQIPKDGPLTVADDLPIRPFEVTIRLPNAWSPEKVQTAFADILSRLILRHRALQAYRQHL